MSALLCSTGNAAEMAVVHLPGRTTVGTKDFTVSGFGQPKAVLCMSSYGVTNGTRVSQGGFTIGVSDGTRQHTAFVRTKNGVTPTLAGRRADTSDILYYADENGTTIGRVQFASWITDGVRLNWSVAPASAYQVSCTLFGGVGISNAYANIVSTPATVDTSTTVSTVGFRPDVLIGILNGDGVYNDSNQAQADLSVGFALPNATQKAISWRDTNGQTTTSVVWRNLSNRIGRSGNGTQQVEIQNFTTNGFDATTRTTGAVATLGYLALKLDSVSASVLAVDSPAATGSQSITGITGTPQWGLLIGGSGQLIDSSIIDTDSESFGISSFTASTQSCFGISADDGVTTSSTDSLVNTKPMCLIKDGAAFFDASFTSFSPGTATFNYGTANGTTRKWVGLFVSAPAVASSSPRSRQGVFLP